MRRAEQPLVAYRQLDASQQVDRIAARASLSDHLKARTADYKKLLPLAQQLDAQAPADKPGTNVQLISDLAEVNMLVSNLLLLMNGSYFEKLTKLPSALASLAKATSTLVDTHLQFIVQDRKDIFLFGSTGTQSEFASIIAIQLLYDVNKLLSEDVLSKCFTDSGQISDRIRKLTRDMTYSSTHFLDNGAVRDEVAPKLPAAGAPVNKHLNHHLRAVRANIIRNLQTGLDVILNQHYAKFLASEGSEHTGAVRKKFDTQQDAKVTAIRDALRAMRAYSEDDLSFNKAEVTLLEDYMLSTASDAVRAQFRKTLDDADAGLTTPKVARKQ